ncbi:MAG TPA: hypothetical protein VLJ17_01375 [Xanthobacteraceae bacterium]|nr:hypothetical protein [Xanthobacteraceae bacterium]
MGAALAQSSGESGNLGSIAGIPGSLAYAGDDIGADTAAASARLPLDVKGRSP